MRQAIRAMLLVVTLGALAGAALFGGQRYLEYRVADAVNARIAELPAQVNARYRAVTVNPLERTAAIHDLLIVGEGLFPDARVRRVSVREYSRGTPLPEHLRMRFHDVYWVRGGWPRTLDVLEAGLNGPVVGDITLEMRFDQDSQALWIDEFTVELHSGDRVSLQGRFYLQPMGILDHPYDGPASGLELVGLEGEWHDRGLFASVLEQLAREQGMTGRTLAGNLLGELDWAAAEWGDPQLNASVEALQRFVHDPGELRLRIDAGDPLSVVFLGERFLVDPPAALRRLSPELDYMAPQHDANRAPTLE